MPKDKKKDDKSSQEEVTNLVVIGTAGCGKSCITIRFIANRFVEEYEPTLEDSFRQTVTIDGVTSTLNIYDTAGIEEFPTVRDGYMREADGFLCVYAITNEESFAEVTELYEFVNRVREDHTLPFVICGNKCDLEDRRVVSKSKGEELARKLGVTFMETSALSGKNIEVAFQELVRLVRRYKAAKNPHKGNQPKDDSCCTIV